MTQSIHKNKKEHLPSEITSVANVNPNHLLGSPLEKLIDPNPYTTRKGTWYILKHLTFTVLNHTGTEVFKFINTM